MFHFYLCQQSYPGLSDRADAEGKDGEVALRQQIGSEIEEIHAQEVAGTRRNRARRVCRHFADVEADGESSGVGSLGRELIAGDVGDVWNGLLHHVEKLWNGLVRLRVGPIMGTNAQPSARAAVVPQSWGVSGAHSGGGIEEFTRTSPSSPESQPDVREAREGPYG